MQKLHNRIILISIENNSQLQLKVDVLIMFQTVSRDTTHKKQVKIIIIK